MSKAPRKHQKPLTIDGEFEETLERFAQTDPAEVAAAVRDGELRGLHLRNKRVSEDDNGNVCLNDLYELAGRPANLKASEWLRHKKVQALKSALDDRLVCNTHRSLEDVSKSTYYAVGRGVKSRTYAHPVLALEYAESLNPDLGIEVKEVFLRFRAADISLANDILDRIIEQAREDELRVQLRDQTAARNLELAEEGKRANCTERWEYAELHNAGYRGLYNGLDAEGIHDLKKLTKNQKILDHMSAAETAANAFWITQAALRMKRENPKTPDEAFAITEDAGKITRKAMEEIGGVMPEDMAVADGISEARKRLKKNQELVESRKRIDKKG